MKQFISTIANKLFPKRHTKHDKSLDNYKVNLYQDCSECYVRLHDEIKETALKQINSICSACGNEEKDMIFDGISAKERYVLYALLEGELHLPMQSMKDKAIEGIRDDRR